ncbi:beta-galactosidase subunit beta [Tessaracoccus lubricantis]|uniref:Beta-galactosidase subunit beta n=1 Tax=Tessaracoccus lubricantis TaxID=545543 RepID=A0ABP9F6M2_9ACTN
MRLFTDRDLMVEIMDGHKKWRRTIQALESAPTLQSGVAYSIVDSLTYRKDRTAELTTDELVGRRRYHGVVAALDGDVDVAVAPKADLTEEGDYSDLTDRQPYSGDAQIVTVPKGAVLVVDIDEAFRILPTPDAEAVLLHVSVEGATFHNK